MNNYVKNMLVTILISCLMPSFMHSMDGRYCGEPLSEKEAEKQKAESELIKAAARGDICEVKWHLDNGVDINCVDNIYNFSGDALDYRGSSRMTPLIFAIKEGCAGIVECLLNRGASVSQADCDGDTPLDWATTYNNKPIVKLLLENGANIHVVNDFGNSPFVLAQEEEFTEIVELMKAYDKNLSDG